VNRTALPAGSGESKVRAIVDRLVSKVTCLVKDSLELILGPLLARAAPPNFSELHKFNLIVYEHIALIY